MLNLQALVSHCELVQKNLAQVALKMERGEGEILSSKAWKDAQAALACMARELLNQPNNVARQRAAIALLREAGAVVASPTMQTSEVLQRLAQRGAEELTEVAAWLVERNG